MGLKNATPVDNSAFEDMDGNEGTEGTVESQAATDEAAAADAAPAAEAAPAKTSALAAQSGGRALTSATVMKQNVLSGLKDAFHISFDAVPRVKAEQGDLLLVDPEISLGTHVVLEVVSYQDRWVASPGDNKAPIELVKFSDNEHTADDGTDLNEHVRMLQEQGYGKAKKQQRLVVVGELLAVKSTAEDAQDLIGSLVQIDLPDSGRRSFQGHVLQVSFKVAKGRLDGAEAARMQFTATKERSKQGDAYTKITVSLPTEKA